MSTKGMHRKFVVERTDGLSDPGKKHEGCQYFVLDLTHDQCALPAIEAYAAACEITHPELAADLRLWVRDELLLRGMNEAGWER